MDIQTPSLPLNNDTLLAILSRLAVRDALVMRQVRHEVLLKIRTVAYISSP